MTRLYVGNLAKNVTEDDLKQLFSLNATPFLTNHSTVELCNDEKTGQSKGFAFLNVTESVAMEIKNLNNIEFYGRQLVIEDSKTNQNQDPIQKSKKTKKTFGKTNYRNHRSICELPHIDDNDRHDLIDGGVNLTNGKFLNSRETVVKKALQAGVTKFVVTGLTLNGSRKACDMAEGRKDTCYAAVSIHPHWVDDKNVPQWNDKAEKTLRELASKPYVVAIGETGLDFKQNYSPVDLAKKAFKAQVQIAIDLKKALIVHEREACDEVLQVLQEKGVNTKFVPVVLHCFTGSVECLEKYLQKGYYIGVTGFTCKETHGVHIREAIKSGKLPLEKIILQSNAPYMVPNPPKNEQSALDRSLLECCYQGQNEPHTLPILLRTIAKDVNKSEAEVARIFNDNARKVYGIN